MMTVDDLNEAGLRWQWAMWAIPVDQAGGVPATLSRAQNEDGYEIMSVYMGMVSPPGGSRLVTGAGTPQVFPAHIILGRRLITREKYENPDGDGKAKES